MRCQRRHAAEQDFLLPPAGRGLPQSRMFGAVVAGHHQRQPPLELGQRQHRGGLRVVDATLGR